MSSSETPPPTPQEAQEALNVIADLLCPAHKHRITAPGIDLRKQARYSMVIDCPQEDGTIWQVGMSADFRVKVIGRCKVLSTSDSLPGHANITTLVPLCAWEGLQCDDILWLLSIGHLKEGWWEDNPSRLSDQRKDHRQSPHNAVFRALGSHNYVAYSLPSTTLPIAKPGNKDKRGKDEKQDGEGTESQDNVVPLVKRTWGYQAESRWTPSAFR